MIPARRSKSEQGQRSEAAIHASAGGASPSTAAAALCTHLLVHLLKTVVLLRPQPLLRCSCCRRLSACFHGLLLLLKHRRWLQGGGLAVGPGPGGRSARQARVQARVCEQ